MKKTLAFILALAMLTVLAACSSGASSMPAGTSVDGVPSPAPAEVSRALAAAEPSAQLMEENTFVYTSPVNTNKVLYVASIKNTGTVPVEITNVSIDLEDTAGSILTTSSSVNVHNSKLNPGERAYICENLLSADDQDTNLQNVGNPILHYSVEELASYHPPAVALSELSLDDSSGWLEAIGRITNTGEEEYSNLMLAIPIRNSEGFLCTVALGMVGSLAPAKQRNFPNRPPKLTLP